MARTTPIAREPIPTRLPRVTSGLRRGARALGVAPLVAALWVVGCGDSEGTGSRSAGTSSGRSVTGLSWSYRAELTKSNEWCRTLTLRTKDQPLATTSRVCSGSRSAFDGEYTFHCASGVLLLSARSSAEFSQVRATTTTGSRIVRAIRDGDVRQRFYFGAMSDSPRRVTVVAVGRGRPDRTFTVLRDSNCRPKALSHTNKTIDQGILGPV